MPGDDAAGIHPAVRDEAEPRRRDRDPIESELAARLDETPQPLLLLEEGRDDRRSDVTARGVKGGPRLGPPSRVGAEGIDEQPAEEARKQRHALPDPLAPPTGQNLLEDLHIRAIRDDHVVEALADAPLSLAWLPIQLLAREPAEHALRFVGDQGRLH